MLIQNEWHLGKTAVKHNIAFMHIMKGNQQLYHITKILVLHCYGSIKKLKT